MILILAYLGGVLTILSPCILPVLPFVFARAGQPFARSSLPLLLGMALAFAGVATLAAVGGGWAVQANQYGRYAAIVLLAVFGLTLVSGRLADLVARPFVALGARLTAAAQDPQGGAQSTVTSSFLLGAATGLLWAPCAGPILGLVLTGAALEGATGRSTLLLFAYAAGAATSLAVVLLVGGRVFTALKRSLGVGEWIRRVLGIAVLAGVAAIALGADTGLLTRLSVARTASLEEALITRIHPASPPVEGELPADRMAAPGSGMMMAANPHAVTDAQTGAMTGAMTGVMSAQSGAHRESPLAVEGQMPSLEGAVQWLNSPPLTAAGLRGKVVLVDFWTYSCINCLRALPYVRAWAEKYKSAGLVVIGVHAPEFAFEKDIDNVRRATSDLGVTYPVAIDNNYAIWRAFKNQYWPAHYFIDASGQVRHHHFGEGEYAQSEAVIQQLLAEAGHADAGGDFVAPQASGVGMAADDGNVGSPETYVGYGRADGFASSPDGPVHDRAADYAAPAGLDLNKWALAGRWAVRAESAALEAAPGRIVYRFHARDVHLVLGPAAGGKPVRFRVRLDGAAPGSSHGVDADVQGRGTVTGQRLYQLIRQSGPIADRTVEIEFLDAGVAAFAFTFG